MESVLVLNQDFSPITVSSVQRAFSLIYLGKADLIAEAKDKCLRSISKSFPFPSVIKVKNYVSLPYKGVVMSRQNIIKRDNGKCQYCGTNRELTLDHVIPTSKGGKSTWTNLVTACKNCNSKKGDKSIAEVGMKLMKQPIKPSYVSFLQKNHGGFREDWEPFLYPKKVSA